MPNETPTSSASWTFETLLAHLQSLIDANDKRYAQRFSDSGTAVSAALNAAKEAVAKAEVAAEKRFESVNEFRATLSDQQRMLMPRQEAELRFEALEKKIDALGMTQDKKITVLERSNAEYLGQKSGARELWAWIAAAIGILFGALALFFKNKQ